MQTCIIAHPETPNLIAAWSAADPRPGDRVGLFKVGDPNTDFIELRFTNGAPSGVLTFSAPTTSGEYEVRYLFEKAETSNSVTVSEPSPPPPPSAEFEVIVHTDYINQPDFRPFGAKNGWLGPDPRLQVLSTDNDHGGATCTNFPLPSEDAVKNHWRIKGGVDFVGLESFTGLIYDNLECWWPPESRVDDYVTLYGWYKEAIPNAMIGVFGPLPASSGYGQLAGGPGSEGYDSWVARSTLMIPVAAAVDVLYPEAYTYSVDQEEWRKTTVAYIDESRRISGGKPVYPFINPRYAPSRVDGPAFELVPKEYFRFQLDTIKAAGAAGVVIWGADNSNSEWNDDLPWWQATKDFLATQ